MSATTRTQNRVILDHMQKGYRVNPEMAKGLCGSTRLAARINDIKLGLGVDKPYALRVRDRFIRVKVNVASVLKDTRVKEYWLNPEPVPESQQMEML